MHGKIQDKNTGTISIGKCAFYSKGVSSILSSQFFVPSCFISPKREPIRKVVKYRSNASLGIDFSRTGNARAVESIRVHQRIQLSTRTQCRINVEQETKEVKKTHTEENKRNLRVRMSAESEVEDYASVLIKSLNCHTNTQTSRFPKRMYTKQPEQPKEHE